ncbi:MAG: hypothetical protein MI922_27355 [Bacteroidales bacterium]|nr:hypothetical protein [Bacteroidales bacterium]
MHYKRNERRKLMTKGNNNMKLGKHAYKTSGWAKIYSELQLLQNMTFLNETKAAGSIIIEEKINYKDYKN